MNIKLTNADAFWSYAAVILSAGIGIIMMPLILVFLGDDDVAMYYIFSNLSTIAFLFDFGFSPSISRSMAYAWAGANRLSSYGVVDDVNESNKPNFLLIKKIMSSCKVLYIVLASMCLFLCATLGTIYIWKVTQNIGFENYFVSWIIYAVAIFLNVLYGYYAVFLRGVGAVSSVNIALVIARVVQLILTVVLLLMGKGLLGVAIAYLAYGIIFRYIAKKKYYNYCNIEEEIKKIEEKVSKDDIKQIIKTVWPNTWRDGLVTLSNYLLTQAITIIASMFLTLLETGIYSLSVQLVSVVGSVASTMNTACGPVIQSSYILKNDRMLKRKVSLVVVSLIYIYAIGILGLIFVGRPIVSWLKPSYELDVLILISVAISQFVVLYRNSYCCFFSCTNRLFYYKSFVASSLFCVVLAIILTKEMKMGVYGLVLSQIISQLIYNVWKWPMLAKKELSITSKEVFIFGTSEIINMFRREK